jgi:hypothetical protein
MMALGTQSATTGRRPSVIRKRKVKGVRMKAIKVGEVWIISLADHRRERGDRTMPARKKSHRKLRDSRGGFAPFLRPT